MRIAHLSDLHFSRITLSPTQFFSKRWIGNFNLFLSRKKKTAPQKIKQLIEFLKKQEIDLVIITGDLTSTSHKKELEEAALFVNSLKEAGREVIVIPGNHDHYTKKAYREKHFYDFFSSTISNEPHPLCKKNLKEHAISVKPLPNNWWCIALDTALSTSLISSRGLFSKKIEEELKGTLSQIPKNHSILLVNHFPFFQTDSPRKTLERGHALKELLQESPQVKLYLHGHTHRSCIADLRAQNLPIIVDSGSTGLLPRLSWNLIDLQQNGCTILSFEPDQTEWAPVKKEDFTWQE